MPHVLCSVSSCRYNDWRGNQQICIADTIKVNNMANHEAKTSEETKCQTFIPDVKA